MKKVLLTFLLFVGLTGAAFSQTANFTKANAAYRDGKYDEAMTGYESILRSGLESGPVYYNLGNSYFKKKEIGKAILNYERAKRLIPRDPDLVANAQFAQSEVQDDVKTSLNGWDMLWQRHIEFYSLDEMVLIMTFLLILLGVAHLVILNFNWKPGRLAMGALAVLFLIFAYGLQRRIITQDNASIMIKNTSARFEPNEKATVYFELPQGQRVKSREKEGAWIKIERPDGKSGWTNSDTVEGI